MNHYLKWQWPKKNKLVSTGGKTVAVVDNYAPVTFKGEVFNKAIRTLTCQLLVNDHLVYHTEVL